MPLAAWAAAVETAFGPDPVTGLPSPPHGVRGWLRPWMCSPHLLQTQTSSEASLSARPTAQPKTTLNNGYLGSRNDEERSEMRYVV